jgi:tetratricopeptide (TPR) repeat protein
VRDRQVTRLRAVASLHQLRDDLKTIYSLVNAPEMEPRQWEEGIAQGRRILEQFHVLDTPNWQETASVRALSAEEAQGLREDVGELLLLLAGATARQARISREPATRPELLGEALRLNGLAEGCYPADGSPRALWQQRADLTRLSGRAEEAEQLLQMAKAIPLRSARDSYLLIADHLEENRLREAMAFLQEASRHEPDNFTWWLLLGNCQAGLGQARDAANSYDHGIALWPDGYWAYFNRGVLYLEQLKNYRHAREDFDQFLLLRPDVPQGYYNRALAKFYLGDWAGAEADLTHLLQRPNPSLRAYFLRAKVRQKAGDLAGARQDWQEGLRREPSEEKDWIARGVARQTLEPEAALRDFLNALQLNPRSRTALLDQAHVLAELLGRTAEAVQVLNDLVSLYPDYVHARASRGVYYARLGQREKALRDAHDCLRRDSRPPTHYQVAGIYALSARQHQDDRRQAFRLLSLALDKGYGLDLLDKDRDLDSIRDDPEFGRLVNAARERVRRAAEQRSTTK